MYVGLYNKIRLPAAKSDVARLLILYELGGLYINCHNGIRNIDEVKRLLSCLKEYEAIFLDRFFNFLPRRPGEHFLINGPIFSRRHSKLMMIIARQAFANLAWQQRLEEQYGFVSYHLANLTGPGLLNEMLFEPGSWTRDIRGDFA